MSEHPVLTSSFPFDMSVTLTDCLPQDLPRIVCLPAGKFRWSSHHHKWNALGTMTLNMLPPCTAVNCGNGSQTRQRACKSNSRTVRLCNVSFLIYLSVNSMLRSVMLVTANMIATYVSTNISIQLCHSCLSLIVTAHVPLIDQSGNLFNLNLEIGYAYLNPTYFHNTYLLTFLLTYSLIYLCTYLLTYWLSYSIAYLFTRLLTDFLTFLLTYLLTFYWLTHLLIIYLLTEFLT